jgi:hypothetical protein
MRAAFVLALALAACERPASPAPPEPVPAQRSAAAPAEPPVCTDVPAFADLAWVPATATMLAVLDLGEPSVAPALAEVSKLARAPGHGLPIATAFAMANWSSEVPLVRGTIDALGMNPGALAQVELEGVRAWVWPAACDLDRLEPRTVGELRLRWRDAAGFSVASASTERRGDAPFPFDLVALPGDRFALVAAGRGPGFAEALARPQPTPAPPSLAAALASIDPAPVRAAVRDRGLLDPSSTSAGRDVVVRATAPGAARVESPDGR